jgi:hypothetical protein
LTLFPEIKTYPPETLQTMAANHDAQFKALLQLKAVLRDFSKQFVFLRGLCGSLFEPAEFINHLVMSGSFVLSRPATPITWDKSSCWDRAAGFG